MRTYIPLRFEIDTHFANFVSSLDWLLTFTIFRVLEPLCSTSAAQSVISDVHLRCSWEEGINNCMQVPTHARARAFRLA